MDEILEPACSYESYRPAEDLLMRNARGYYIRGTARIANGRMDEGISDLETAKQQDPEFGHAYWALGIFYRKRGDKALALKEFERAAELFTVQGESTMAASAQRQAEKLR